MGHTVRRSAPPPVDAQASAPVVDPQTGLHAALWRWHLGRVFVYQFGIAARRVPPEAREAVVRHRGKDGPEGARWTRYRVSSDATLGLAAVKHAQRREQPRQVWTVERMQQGRELFERRPNRAPERPHSARHGRRGKGGGGGSICPICGSMVRLDSHLCAAAHFD